MLHLTDHICSVYAKEIEGIKEVGLFAKLQSHFIFRITYVGVLLFSLCERTKQCSES